MDSAPWRDWGPDSDVDLPAAFDEARVLSVPDVAGIELQLADLPGVRVDLSEEGTGSGTCFSTQLWGAGTTVSGNQSTLRPRD